MGPEPEARREGIAMGTSYSVVVGAADARLLPAAAEMIADLERRWSRFVADSEIAVLNRAAGAPVIVSPDTFAVIAAAVDGARATGGRFDPTVHDSLVGLGYDRTFAAVADAGNRTARPVAAPGVDGVELDAGLSAVTLPVGVGLDLGGIGKGAAADRVVAMLAAAGAAGAAVAIGGDVRVWGDSPSGTGWAFVDDGGAPLAFGALRDGGVCTSSIRRRRWQTSSLGEVHHLVDPATGHPTDGTIQSVTVVAATAQQAEVLCKAAMVAGRAAPTLLESFGVAGEIRWSAAA